MRSAPERRRRPWLALVLATLPAVGRAGDAPGDKVEIGGLDLASLLDLSVEAVTHHAEPASAAPATVFVLTGDDLRRQGFRTVDEALGSVPGLFAYPGRFPQVGVRGLGIVGDFTSRLLVLIDGHPLTNSVGADLGRGLPLPLAAITRIEVIKGPVGSVYGPSAFFGVVNLVTAGGAPGGEALAGGEAAQGEARTWEGSALWRGDVGAARTVVAADAYGSEGRDWRFPELAGTAGGPAGGVARRVDFGAAQTGYLRSRWSWGAAVAACNHAAAGLSGAPHPSHRDDLESTTCLGELSAERTVAGALSLQGRASFDWFQQNARRGTAAPPEGVGHYHTGGTERWPTLELRADWHPRGPVRLGLGSTVQHHRVTIRTASDAVPEVGDSLARSFVTSNTWLLAELRPGDSLALHAGLTYFHHSIFGRQVTPKAALVWQPGRDHTVKAIWSRGFRPPTYVEALLDDHLAFLPSPGLKPERVDSLELAYERRLGARALVTLSAFRNEYQDLIRYEAVPAPGLDGSADPSDPGSFRQQARNGGRLVLLGGELAVLLRLGDALQAWGGVNLQRVSQRARLNFPSWTGNLAVSSRALWHPLQLSARGAAVGRRAKDSTTLLPGQRASAPAGLVLTGQASLDVPGVEGLQLELAVVNLLDARAVSPAPGEDAPVSELPAAARTFRLDLRYRF